MNDIDKRILDLIKSDYSYYYDDKRIAVGGLPGGGKSAYFQKLRQHQGNCSDEIVKGSHKRTQKIRALMQKRILVGSENFAQQWGEIVNKIRELMKEEHMALTGCSEHEADMFLEMHVEFNHVKSHRGSGGELYLSVDPKIGPKYDGD